VAEAYLRVRLDLIALPGARLSQITEVYSHPQAFTDCHLFLEQPPRCAALRPMTPPARCA
jgi:prephenate dehydratase